MNSDAPSKIPYRCGFCRKQLKGAAFSPGDYLRLLLLVRPYQCPHCFCCFIRPFAWIGRIPLIGRIFQGRSAGTMGGKPGVLPQRDGDMSGSTRAIASLGRRVRRFERRVGKFFSSCWRLLGAIVWFIPGLFLGKRKRRRSRGKFL